MTDNLHRITRPLCLGVFRTLVTTIIMIIVVAMTMTLIMIVTFGEGPGTELFDNDYPELGVTYGAA
jgi:hypothetical protein